MNTYPVFDSLAYHWPLAQWRLSAMRWDDASDFLINPARVPMQFKGLHPIYLSLMLLPERGPNPDPKRSFLDLEKDFEANP